jgi:hypothetical protein
MTQAGTNPVGDAFLVLVCHNAIAGFVPEGDASDGSEMLQRREKILEHDDDFTQEEIYCPEKRFESVAQDGVGRITPNELHDLIKNIFYDERKPLCLGVESLSKIDPQRTGTMNFQLFLQMVRLGRVRTLELLRIQAGADDNCVDFDIHAHFAVAPSRAQSSAQGKPQPPPRSAPGAAGSEGATTGSSSTAKPPPHQPSSVITAPSQRTNQEDEGICTTSDAGQGSLRGQNV